MVQEVEVHQEGEEGDDKIYINSYSIKNINKLFLFLSYLLNFIKIKKIRIILIIKSNKLDFNI